MYSQTIRRGLLPLAAMIFLVAALVTPATAGATPLLSRVVTRHAATPNQSMSDRAPRAPAAVQTFAVQHSLAGQGQLRQGLSKHPGLVKKALAKHPGLVKKALAKHPGLVKKALAKHLRAKRALARAMGFWVVDRSGGVGAAGGAPELGGLTHAEKLATPVVSMAATPDGRGYWLVTGAGTVFNFGNAHAYGYVGPPRLHGAGRGISAMAATIDGKGYWLLSNDGRVFNFGDARPYGSLTQAQFLAAGSSLATIAATPEGGGYWVVGSNGKVFCFGDAPCFASAERGLNQVVGLAPTPDGKGYWLATAVGKVAAFGDAGLHGSVRSAQLPVVGIAAQRGGQGYWLADQAGATFGFGSATATSASGLAAQVVAIVPDPMAVPAGPAIAAGPGARLLAQAQADAAGQAAVRFALAQVGKPYVYGDAGPYAYDCSGLAMAAWGQAGVGLPHRAAEQYYSGAHVPLSQLQPGDLVFWASDPGDPATIYHVAIFIGGNETVQATHTGSTVMVMPLLPQDLVPLATQP